MGGFGESVGVAELISGPVVSRTLSCCGVVHNSDSLISSTSKRMVLLLGNDLYYSKLESDCKEDSPVQQSFANDSDHTSSLQRGRSNMTILQNDPDLRTPYKVEDPI